MIMRWLYTIHLRTPGATVLLVANKCDRAVNDVAETAQRVERRVTTLLQQWKDRRGLGQNSGEYGFAFEDFDFRRDKNNAEISMLKGSSLISCDDYEGIPALIGRILQQTVSSIEVPPAWELALETINALRCKCPPVFAALKHLQLPATIENVDACWSGPFITKEELIRLWRNVVGTIKDEIHRTAKDGVFRLWQDIMERFTCGVSRTTTELTDFNSDSALEGALWIRWVY